MGNIIILNRFEIRNIRKKKWISQEKMANYLQIDYKTYNRKENWKSDFTLAEYSKIINILYWK